MADNRGMWLAEKAIQRSEVKLTFLYGPLAQKSSARACHARGHRFKSGMGRQYADEMVLNCVLNQT